MDTRTGELDPFDEIPPSVGTMVGSHVEDSLITPDAERLIDIRGDDERR